ncbi:hypothetical protein SAMN03097708_01947 [Thiohalomonas denitrificans]|uniref:Uncharacterized protein n=1 Tax=Thiohalomonas denitrificans TaxID=415747 RepID=A0A1G5QE18_9GAMM|nr:hypothetical protein SAMN03097708_01947 [Thiohalomonas denitrificans]
MCFYFWAIRAFVAYNLPSRQDEKHRLRKPLRLSYLLFMLEVFEKIFPDGEF